jgi:signal peptidase
MAREITSTKQPARLLLRWTARLVLLAFALLVVGALAVVVVLPRATHGSALTVLTGSMTPGIPVGSVVVIRPVDPGTLQVGDVATYQAKPDKPDYITHRIQRIDTSTTPTTPTSFIFKGDANRGADIDPVSAKAIRGKVWFHVPYLGAVRDGLHGKGGITLVGMLLLGGYALSQLSGAFRERKNPHASGDPAPVDPSELVRLQLDRTLILVTLPIASVTEQTGLTPAQAARQWGAILLDQNHQVLRLLIAPPEDGVGAAVELLQAFDPVELVVCETPTLLAGASSEREKERNHATR